MNRMNTQGKPMQTFQQESPTQAFNIGRTEMSAVIDDVKIFYPAEFRLSTVRRKEFKHLIKFFIKTLHQNVHAIYLNKNVRNPEEMWDFKMSFEHGVNNSNHHPMTMH